MASRLNLHEELCALLGSRNVYYQPPASVLIKYPAIIYERSFIRSDFADDTQYIGRVGYSVTVVDKNPDSDIVMNLSKWPYCRFDRHFASDNLNHDVFTLYY